MKGLLKFKTILVFRKSVLVSSVNARRDELFLNMFRMNPVDAKTEGRTTSSSSKPSVNNVCNECRLIHCGFQIGFAIVSGNGAHSLEIRMGGGIDLKWRQDALVDQFLGCRGDDQSLEPCAQPLRPWGG